MQVKSWLYKGKLINLPYVIKVDKPKEVWGIFGDSFAQLRENELHFESKGAFPYEYSWISFLGNACNAQCESYGVSNASIPDIIYTILNCKKSYDRYIIFMTSPDRPNIFSPEKLKVSLCEELKEFLKGKKALICYWDEKHKIFNFGHKHTLCSHYISHPNLHEGKQTNSLDRQHGYHHMSLRGNFLFAFDLYHLINPC